MACLRLKPTSDALLPQGLPAKIIRLRRSGRQAKAHISTKPDDFRRPPRNRHGHLAVRLPSSAAVRLLSSAAVWLPGQEQKPVAD